LQVHAFAQPCKCAPTGLVARLPLPHHRFQPVGQECADRAALLGGRDRASRSKSASSFNVTLVFMVSTTVFMASALSTGTRAALLYVLMFVDSKSLRPSPEGRTRRGTGALDCPAMAVCCGVRFQVAGEDPAGRAGQPDVKFTVSTCSADGGRRQRVRLIASTNSG
jgi:hypothetical protein